LRRRRRVFCHAAAAEKNKQRAECRRRRIFKRTPAKIGGGSYYFEYFKLNTSS